MKFKQRLAGIFVVLILLPAVFITVFFMINAVNKELIASLTYSVEQMSVIIQNDLNEAKLLTDALCENPLIKKALSTEGSRQTMNQQIDEHKEISDIIRSCYRSDNIYAIRLFCEYPKFYTAEKVTYFGMAAFSQNPYFSNVTVRGSFTNIYYQSYKDKQDTNVLSYIRTITDEHSVVRTVGAIAIDIKADYIKELLSGQDNSRFERLSLVRPDGTVLLSNSAERTGNVDLPDMTEMNNGFFQEKNRFLAVYPIKNTDWILVGKINMGFYGFLYAIGYTGQVALCALLVAVIVIAANVLVANPIGALVGVLKSADPEKAATRSQGVFHSLSDSVQYANRLITERQEQIILQQKMKLSLLQAQINPHFLYNQLDSIGWMIKSGEIEKALETIMSLGRYYRLNLSKGRENIFVEEDLSIALIYAKALQYKAEKRFDIDAVIDDEAKVCVVPKMTIQPIVENCILHGFSDGTRSPRIEIDIYLDEDTLVICISDNGNGIPAYKLAEILSAGRQGTSFGLYNVQQRIQLFSGSDRYGIQIESEQGRNTSVTLRIAARGNDPEERT